MEKTPGHNDISSKMIMVVGDAGLIELTNLSSTMYKIMYSRADEHRSDKQTGVHQSTQG